MGPSIPRCSPNADSSNRGQLKSRFNLLKKGSIPTIKIAFPILHLYATLRFASRFLRNGGRIVSQKIDSFQEVAGKYDVVVNCTGLGAKKLCTDFKLVPIRGQVIKVKAPWVKTAFYADYDTYIIPGFQGVTLGGCRNFDSYNTEVCRHDSAAIRERCEALLPSLKGAPVIREAVGLRPHRDPVRVEPEVVGVTGGHLKVVHNYGHGGYGVTTSPGTAIYATKLVTEMVKSNSKL